MGFLVTDRKFFNQLVNGSDFSLNTSVHDSYLKCNVNEVMKAVITARFSWSSSASAANNMTISGNVITRQNGSFLQDGFVAGDVIDVVDSGSIFSATDRNVTSVSDLVLIYDGSTASQAASETLQVLGKTALRGFRFQYNIVANTSGISWKNLQDGSAMQWNCDGVGAGAIGSRDTITYTPGSWAAMPTTGETGSFAIKFNQQIDAYTQEFVFEHIFKVFPFFLDGERSNFEAGQNISLLSAGASYKYIFSLNGGATSLNPNEIKSVVDSALLGNVGGFEQNFNGNPANFKVHSIVYKDNATGNTISTLQGDAATDVEVLISSPTSIDCDQDHIANVQLCRLPSPAAIVLSDDFDTNFFAEELRQVRGVPANSGTRITNLIVSNGSPAATYLKINFTIDFENIEKGQLANGDDFMLAFNVDDAGNPGINRTNCHIVGKLTKNSDVTGLFDVDSNYFFRFDMPKSDTTNFTDYKGWIRDEFVQETTFWLDTTKNAFINQLRMKLVAMNTVTGNYFILDSQTFSLTSSLTSGAIQILAINKDRAFNLPAGNFMKNIALTMGSLSGGKQYYTLYFPWKLPWMDYLALTGVDPVFFNISLLNNGLNYKCDRFSESENYIIKTLIEADVMDTSGVSTTYQVQSPEILVMDYGADNGIGQFSDYMLECLTIGGSPLPDNQISKNEDTLIRATFTPTTPISTSDVLDGLIHYELYQNGGLAADGEISTMYATSSGEFLQPKAGKTKLDLINNGTSIELECIVKASAAAAFPDQIQFSFSPKIVNDISELSDAKYTEEGLLKETEGGIIKQLE